jgi:hypothetical protein
VQGLMTNEAIRAFKAKAGSRDNSTIITPGLLKSIEDAVELASKSTVVPP